MPTLVEAKEAIVLQFNTDWAAATPVDYENEAFTPPTDSAWVRLTILHNDSNQQSLGGVGNRKFNRSGSVIVQVFTKVNRGSKEANTLAQTVMGIFEGKTISQIRFTDSTPREIGEDGRWYQVNVESLFNYDEVK